MGQRDKILWTLGLTAGIVALLLWGGRLVRAHGDPGGVFEAGRRVPRESGAPEDGEKQDGTGAEGRAQEGPELSLELPEEPDELPEDFAGDSENAAEPQGTPSSLENAPPSFQEEGASPLPEPAQAEKRTILLTFLGIDTDPAREAQHRGWRSDVMLLCFIDPDAPACTVLTVPRDTRARVRRLDKQGNVKSTRWDKINAAYAYGGGKEKFSHENALHALSELLGLELSYYVSIDMDAIGPVADAVGGVPLVLDVSIDGVGEAGETVNLTGDAAYTYVRRRKGVTGGSDLARTGRQQNFLRALAGKVKSMGAKSELPRLFFALQSRVRTNLSLEQLSALAGVLDRLDAADIRMQTLPGRAKTIDGTSYFLMDEEETQALLDGVMGE